MTNHLQSGSGLGSAIIDRYKAEYLEVSLPLTRVGECPDQAHPYLTLSSPEHAIWSNQYLQWAIICFLDACPKVKFRLWAITSHLNVAHLLLHTFECHFPLALPVHIDQAFMFKKAKYSEMEMCSFYNSPGFITPSIPYSSDSYQLWNNYLVAVADLLAQPHARALVFKGGLISQLVQALSLREFFDGLLYGPSAQVTQHNKGFTNPVAETVEDKIS